MSQPGGAPSLPPPAQVWWATVLLAVNLALGVTVTVLSLTHINELIAIALRNRTLTDIDLDRVRQAVRSSLYVRAATNVAVGAIYLRVALQLRQGKRTARRRLLWLSGAGSAGMAYLLSQPYPVVFTLEHVVQLVVLLGIGACMLSAPARAFVGPRRPRGRSVDGGDRSGSVLGA